MRILKRKKDLPRRRYADDVVVTSSSHVFKRNRTLTGTTSNRLNSVGVDSDLKSPRAHVHGLAVQRRKIGVIFLMVLLIAASLLILIVNFTASVKITVANTDISKAVDENRYIVVIQDYLNGNPFSRLAFFLDQKSLSSYVSDKLPEVSKVSLVGSEGLGESNFALILRKPVAGWQINSKQYYVDSSGIPFTVNYFSVPTVSIVDNSGVSLKSNSTAIASSRFLSFVGRVVSMTRARGYNVTQAILPPDTTRELEVRLKEAGYPIKLTIDRPAGEQVEDMVTAVDYFKKQGVTPKYADVRVSGKAFYK